MITVMVVDDNAGVRTVLRPLLEADPGISVVAEAADGRSAVATARRVHPQVTLLDHHMPLADGLSVVEELSRETAVLVLTGSDDAALVAPMLAGGARGYLVHGHFDPPELSRAVRAVAGGKGWLTPQAASVAAAVLRHQHHAERATTDARERLRATRRAYRLSDREHDVMTLLCQGRSNAAIASGLGLSEKTVKNHLARIFAKLDVTSRAEAIVRWTGEDRAC